MELYIEWALKILVSLQVFASIVVGLTATPTDDKWVAKIYKVVEKVALVTKKTKEK